MNHFLLSHTIPLMTLSVQNHKKMFTKPLKLCQLISPVVTRVLQNYLAHFTNFGVI